MLERLEVYMHEVDSGRALMPGFVENSQYVVCFRTLFFFVTCVPRGKLVA
jgi:hypothetical protein